MVNLMAGLPAPMQGTHKHAGHWALLDQFLVSQHMYLQMKALDTNWGAKVFTAPYLLQEELVQTGHRPFRSFAGTFYQGGFSDHLPIILELPCSVPWH